MGFKTKVIPPYYIGIGVPHTQAFTNQSSVVVTHNLGRYIIARVLLSDGEEIQCQIVQGANAATFTFSVPLTGTVVFF